MNPQYDFDDIDDYVHGRMSDADRHAFEAALAADPQLARQVEALRAEATVLHSLRREGLLEKLAEWEEETPATPQLTVSWYRRWPLAAAAAVLALLLVWTLWRGFQPNPSEPGMAHQTGQPDSSTHSLPQTPSQDSLTQIAEKNEDKDLPQPPKNPSAETGYAALALSRFNADYGSVRLMGAPGPQTDQHPLQLAAAAIERKQYETALAQLQKIPAAQTDDYTAAQIMTGDVYFLQKKFALAEKAYRQPAQSSKDKFRDVAQWRLLLAYLAVYPQHRADFDRVMAAILAEPEHPYLDAAQKLNQEVGSSNIK